MRLTEQQQDALKGIIEGQRIIDHWEQQRGAYPSGPTKVVNQLLDIIDTLLQPEPPAPSPSFDLDNRGNVPAPQSPSIFADIDAELAKRRLRRSITERGRYVMVAGSLVWATDMEGDNGQP